MKTSPQRPQRAGFTLVEIVMVIALMAIASTMIIVNFVASSDRSDYRSSEELVKASVRKARYLAASRKVMTELTFDRELGELVIMTSGGEELERISLGETYAEDGGGAIRFYQLPAGRGRDALPTHGSRAEQEVTRVRFAPDRSASRYSIEIDDGDGYSERLSFDPFSALTLQPSNS